MTKPFWTTAEGEQIEYSKLSNDHLKNIIKDGYRNPHLIKEARLRGFDLPDRIVDEMSVGDHLLMLESLASNAISGNVLAEEMMDLWHRDRALYFLKLNYILTKSRDEEGEKEN